MLSYHGYFCFVLTSEHWVGGGVLCIINYHVGSVRFDVWGIEGVVDNIFIKRQIEGVVDKISIKRQTEGVGDNILIKRQTEGVGDNILIKRRKKVLVRVYY